MIRYSIIILNILVLFICRLFFQDGVTVSQSVPPGIMPGNDYTIQVTVNKGSIGGFAKLQQQIPPGCTATALESKGSSFSTNGSIIKFIWTSLPSESSFTISYKISVAPDAPAGQNVLSGKFFYVVDNVKQSVDIPESNFNIGGSGPASKPDTANSGTPNPAQASSNAAQPSSGQAQPTPEQSQPSAGQAQAPSPAALPETVPASPATTASSAKKDSSKDSGAGGELNCVRKITATGPADYTVEMTITRGSVSGFAKLQENIPKGFSAAVIQSSGASFSFTDQKVKMVWINFPDNDRVRVSYKITGTAINSGIDGIFSYIENEETKKFIIPSGIIQPSSATASDTARAAPTVPNTETVREQKPASTQNTPASAAGNLTEKMIPSPQASINYKVQVCALRQKPVQVNYFSGRYGLSVGQELHEGWTKYTVNGGFREYKPARDFRETVRGKGVINPFVTAYNSGRRITVQEALMITNQKWYP